MANALIQRMQDQFAGAVAGRQQRVTAPAGVSINPLAAAISITAVLPSPLTP